MAETVFIGCFLLVGRVMVCRRHITQVATQPGQPFQMGFRFLRNQFGDDFQQQGHVEGFLHESADPRQRRQIMLVFPPGDDDDREERIGRRNLKHQWLFQLAIVPSLGFLDPDLVVLEAMPEKLQITWLIETVLCEFFAGN